MRSVEEKTAIVFAGIFLLFSLLFISSGLLKGNKKIEKSDVISQEKNNSGEQEIYVGDYFQKYDANEVNFRKNDPFFSICDNIDYGDSKYSIQSGIVCFK